MGSPFSPVGKRQAEAPASTSVLSSAGSPAFEPGAVAPVVQCAVPVDKPERRRLRGEHLADTHGLVVIQVVVERQYGRVFVHEHVMGEGHEVHRLSEHGASRLKRAGHRVFGFSAAPIIREIAGLRCPAFAILRCRSCSRWRCSMLSSARWNALPWGRFRAQGVASLGA